MWTKIVDIWENFANKVMTRKYDKFFDKLYHYARISYILEIKAFYLKKNYKLSRRQKKEIKIYWGKFIKKINYNSHNFYTNHSGKFDVRYIPDDIYAKYIDSYFNNARIVNGYNDKNYLDLFLNGFPLPQTYVRIINNQIQNKEYENITENQAVKLLLNKNFLIKPTVCTSEGNGIQFFKNATAQEIKSLLRRNNIIFQEIIEQSDLLAKLNKNSVNTIRIMTLNLDGNVYTLNSVIRFGRNGSIVDNASAGGLFCGIKEDKTLTETAFDIHGNKFIDYLKTINYDNKPLQFLDKARNLVKDASKRFAHFKLIGWDIAINKNNEPIIIEANLETCIPDMLQIATGPLFGNLTDRVLSKVFNMQEKVYKVGMDTNQYI